MSALKPSERSEVSVFNKARVLGEFPLFFFFFLLHTRVCFTLHVWNCGQNDPLPFRYGDVLIFTHKGSCKKKWNSETNCPRSLCKMCYTSSEREQLCALLSCLIYRHNTKVEFGVFCGPLPVRPMDHGLLLRMGYCSGLQQSCFHPLQYYRRSYLIPNNQLIHCPWRRGHLCTGNFIPVACLSLPFPLVSPIFSSLSLCLNSEHRQTASVYLGHQLDHI